MTYTAQTITADALAYNSEFPEAAAEIEAGTPVVRVMLHDEDRNGWQIRAVVCPGVIAEDGGWIGAGEPVVKSLRRFDGRLTKTETARRASKSLGIVGAGVPVEFVERGL
jgi:hypothetical protein